MKNESDEQNRPTEPSPDKKRRRRRPAAEWPSALKRLPLEWFDLQALCNYACVSQNTARDWIYASKDPLPAFQVRGKLFVHKSDFDAYLRRHPVKPVDVAALADEVVEEMAHGR